jgi:DNA-binding transcriptional regulator YiaG
MKKKKTKTKRLSELQLRLVRCREDMELTQDEFSKIFGCSVRTLQNWLYGRRNPTGFARNSIERFLEKHSA